MFRNKKHPHETNRDKYLEAFDRRNGDLGRRLEDVGDHGVFPSRGEAANVLASRRCMIYLGIDPTGPDIHLGHTIPLLFLKQLWLLGHIPVIVVGDFTARIGDPTGKDFARKTLTEEEVKNNMKNYLSQIHKILPEGAFEVKYNSSWLSKMSFEDVVKLASHVTVQQMLQRKMFYKHLWKWRCPNCKNISRSMIQFGTQEAYDTATVKNNSAECPHCKQTVSYEKPDIFLENDLRLIGLQEFLYPLMQGYDSVAMEIDGEVGGNDQMFNMLVGRELEKKLLNKDKLVFTTQLLVDAVTGKKMSKSEGGLISISDNPSDMFGKTMSVPDGFIEGMFKLCTEKDTVWITDHANEMTANPYEYKKKLAEELVWMYHGEKEAKKAQEEFEKVFSKKEAPADILEWSNKDSSVLIDVLVKSGMVSSRSEAKRLFEQGAVNVNDKVSIDWGYKTNRGDIIKVGSRRFLKII